MHTSKFNSDRDLETASGNNCRSDQDVHNGVYLDEVPYMPEMPLPGSSGLTDKKYVLYRYRDLPPNERNLFLYGVFPTLEGAIEPAKLRGDGKKSKPRFAWRRGQHFDERSKSNPRIRIAVDEVDY